MLIRSATLEAPVLRVRGVAGAAAEVEAAGSLFGRLVPWDVEADVSDDGRVRYREVFRRGTLPTGATLPVFAGHTMVGGRVERGPLIGRLEALEDRDDGLYGRVILADTSAAAEVRSLADVVGASFSVEFNDPGYPPSAGELVERSAASIRGLAVLTAPALPAYAGAQVLSVRAIPGEDDEDQGDEDPEVPPDPEDDDEENPTARALVQREVARAVARIRGAGAPQPHPLARFSTAYAFFAAARASQSDELNLLFRQAYADHTHARAWVDQTTPNNVGVIQPGWLTEVFGIIDMGRPGISAIGPRSLPPEGMEIDWPYFDGDLHTLVGEQLAEKTDITSVRVDLKKGSTPLKTYAGGSDISWQLIRRSSPSYRDAYLRILAASYGVVTEAVFDQALLAAAGQSVDYDAAVADPDGTALRAAVFEASALVQIATGQPASVLLANTALFIAFGGMPMLVPAGYGTQNVAGTATASNLAVSVSGLTVTHCPELTPASTTAATGVVTNGLAGGWYEDGPMSVSAPDVQKLGEDVTIWGMGATGVQLPMGVVTIAPAGAPLAGGQQSSRSKK